MSVPDLLPNHRLIEHSGELVTFGELFQPLRFHWRLILLCALFAMLAGAAVALIRKPIYQATTQLEVQGFNQDFLDMKSFDLTAADTLLEPYLQTQVKIIESYDLLARVADRLQLNKYDEYKSQPSAFAAWPIAARFLLPTLPGKQSLIKKLSRNLTVRVVDQTHIIEVTCRSTDPRLSRDLANTISSEFIDETLARRLRSTQNTAHWLTNQLQELKTNLEESEHALQEYARGAGLIFTSDKDQLGNSSNIDEAKLRDLQQALSRAQEERVAEQARYQRVTSSPPDSLPEVLDDPTLRDYQVKLTDLKREAADLTSTLAPGHYKVREVRAQIAVLESALERRRANLIERVKTQYESGLGREKLLASSYAAQADVVAAQAAKTVRYSMLKREVDTNRSLYEAILQKVKEAGIVSAVRTANVEVIDSAKIPQLPAKPDPRLYGIAGLFAGAFTGTVLAFTRKAQSPLIRVSGDTALHLRLRELGVIPDATIQRNQGFFLPSNGNGHRGDRLLGAGSGALDLICRGDKDSPVAESIRTTLGSVLLSGSSPETRQVLAVVSASSGDGKTTLASNFAILLAAANRRVLLVDANLRTPRIHEVFSVSNEKGFSCLLREIGSKHEFSSSELYRQTEVAGLFVLPVGPDPFSVTGRLYSSRLHQLFEGFRKEFDAVIIDTAPLSFSDSRPLARLADGVVLIVRAQQASLNAALAAQRLAADGTTVLGAVLNQYT